MPTITPEMASEMLQGQIPQDPGRVAILCRKMLSGEWEEEPSIRVNQAGRVADGVHRLCAVVRFGKPVQMEILRERG